MLRNFLTAVSFLTIIPIPKKFFQKKYSLASALVYFPLVGFFLSLFILFLVSILETVFPERLVNFLLVLLPIIFTAGLHLDAVADFFDGFFQGKNKEDILRIMKDSHIGVWGVTGIIFCILLKWELLMIVPVKKTAYILALTLARWSHVFLSYSCPCARPEGGLGKLIAGKVEIQIFIRASLLTLLVCLLLGMKGILIYGGVMVFVWLMSKVYKYKLGGITGDILGATGEMVEIMVFVMVYFFLESNTFI
ncbi:Cobalamin synthase [hydrothermal vent metagenome]|uniref:Adenosylcobinamide-GDP ribazoletransferase n=1 Tax=hydrothermal vent metagenome TaxID=652676 RepID=A0A3B1D856_9ZZZZ